VSNEALTTKEKVSVLILILVALFTPYWLFTGYTTTVAAVTWLFIIGINNQARFIFLAQTLQTLPLWIFRLVFVFQFYRLYEGKTSFRRTFIFALLNELPLLFYGILTVLPTIWDPIWPVEPKLPIPILSIIGLITIFVLPPRKEPVSWPISESEL
jgi:hypothetical protein